MKYRILSIYAMVSLTCVVAVDASHAALRDKAIDAARLCTKHFPRNERVHGIPTHLLAAIAATESGRWNKTLRLPLPWPWTINANGKPYYLDSKSEAVAKAKELLKSGIKSIDVGCMQVNLKHHPKAFTTLSQAFDPKYNVAYAAKFLKSNYNGSESWTKATSAYHSRTPKYANKYLARVEKVWSKIVGRVRKARAKRGLAAGEYRFDVSDRLEEQKMAALEESFAKAKATPEPKSVKPDGMISAAAEPEDNGSSMRVIELSRKSPSHSKTGVMVIRPASAVSRVEKEEANVVERAPAQLEYASVNDDLFVTNYPRNRVTSRPSSTKNSGGAKMPHFVFVD